MTLSAPVGGIPLSIHLFHATLCRVGLTVTGRAGSATVCHRWKDSIVYPFVSCYSLPRRFDCDRKDAGSVTVSPRGGIPLSIHLSHTTLCRVGLTVSKKLEVPLSASRGGIPLSIHLAQATLCCVGLTATGRAGSNTICTMRRDSIVYPSVSCYTLCRAGLTATGRAGSVTVCPTWRDSIVYPSVSCYTLCRAGLTATGRAGSVTVCPTWRDSTAIPAVKTTGKLPRKFFKF